MLQLVAGSHPHRQDLDNFYVYISPFLAFRTLPAMLVLSSIFFAASGLCILMLSHDPRGTPAYRLVCAACGRSYTSSAFSSRPQGFAISPNISTFLLPFLGQERPQDYRLCPGCYMKLNRLSPDSNQACRQTSRVPSGFRSIDFAEEKCQESRISSARASSRYPLFGWSIAWRVVTKRVDAAPCY